MCLEQISIGKRPKNLEAIGFPCCILNNTHFFETSHGNKKNHCVREVGTFTKQNGISRRYVFITRSMYIKLQSYSLCHQQTKCVYVYQVSNIQHMYVIGFKLLYVLKTTKHTRLYPATHYCTRVQGVKERIA